MKLNIGMLQARAKFAREALADLPKDAPPAERAAAMRAAADTRRAYALAVAQLQHDRRPVAT